MKLQHPLIALMLIALLLTLGIAPAAAQTVDPVNARLITVTGEAQVNVAPDEVVLTLGVETSDKQLRAAKSLNDTRVEKILDAARELGIADKDLQTDRVNIEPRYRDSYEQRDFSGYFVRKTVVITLRDVEQFDAVLAAVLDAGANYVHGIEFRTSELRKHKDKARDLAIKAAKEKATALAGALDQTIGKPYSITEEPLNTWNSYGAWWGGNFGMTQNVVRDAGGAVTVTDEAFAPGQISVTARVTVSFELVE